MTQRNNILLIVKQHPGIDYNSLLAKVSSGYGSVNSARAALSRALKDLNALGMVQRKGNKFFVTGKGAAEINQEMKGKLLIKLNSSLNSKRPVDEINGIVEMLSTLIERSKQDNDLLKAAKGSTEFYVSDLVELHKNIGKRVHTLKYLEGVMLQQISSLEELDFNDKRRLKLGKGAGQVLERLAGKEEGEVAAEFSNEKMLEVFSQRHGLKPHGNTVSIETKKIAGLLAFVEKTPSPERSTINIYLPSVKVRVDAPYVYVVGPISKLKGISEQAE